MTDRQAFDAIDAGITSKDLGLGSVIAHIHDNCPTEFDAIARALAAAQSSLATRILHTERLQREADTKQISIDFDGQTDKIRSRRNRSSKATSQR